MRTDPKPRPPGPATYLSIQEAVEDRHKEALRRKEGVVRGLCGNPCPEGPWGTGAHSRYWAGSRCQTCAPDPVRGACLGSGWS